MTDDISEAEELEKSEHDDHFMDVIGHDQNYDGGGNKTTKVLKSYDVNQDIIQHLIKESEKKDALIEELKKEKYALEKTLSSLPRIYKFSEVTDIFQLEYWSVLFFDCIRKRVEVAGFRYKNELHNIVTFMGMTIDELKAFEKRYKWTKDLGVIRRSEGINYVPLGLVSSESLATFSLRNEERIDR